MSADRAFFMEKGQLKATLMSEDLMKRAIKRMAHQILEQNDGAKDLVFLGIRRRGVPLAHMLAQNISEIEGSRVPVGELDITFYRDDLSEKKLDPMVGQSKVDFSVKDKIVVLVDDVIFTGRTASAALNAVRELGRPARVQLAVLIDRGHRELPIRPDYVGKNVPTSRNEVVSVKVTEFDGQMCVNLYSKTKEKTYEKR